jgi:hypothetical protein
MPGHLGHKRLAEHLPRYFELLSRILQNQEEQIPHLLTPSLEQDGKIGSLREPGK